MPTLADVLETYLEYKTLKPITAKQYRQFIERCTSDWLDLEISSIDKKMMLDKYNQVKKEVTYRATSEGVGQANGLFRILRALYNFASVYYDIALLNPIAVVQSVEMWRKLEDRTDFVPAHKLWQWYRLLHDLPAVDRDFFLVVILTGARFAEIADLSWAEVDLNEGMLHIPPHRTKGNKWHHQPLPRQAWNILRERKLLSGQSPFVFSTSENPNGVYSENRRAYMKMEKALDCPCNPHTLRRTFATHALNKVHLEPLQIKRCLNHANTDITERYMQRDPEEMRVSYQLVADYLMLKMRGEKPRLRLPMQA